MSVDAGFGERLLCVEKAKDFAALFEAAECAPAKIIVGDITYLPFKNGRWCYLTVWQDKVTRRIIGWSLAETFEAELVISALRKAILKGKVQAGAIIYT